MVMQQMHFTETFSGTERYGNEEIPIEEHRYFVATDVAARGLDVNSLNSRYPFLFTR
jgi:imidazoleglycerol phosphate dehydratase HisB